MARGTAEDAQRALALIEEKSQAAAVSEMEIVPGMIQALSKDRRPDWRPPKTLEKILVKQKTIGD